MSLFSFFRKPLPAPPDPRFPPELDLRDRALADLLLALNDDCRAVTGAARTKTMGVQVVTRVQGTPGIHRLMQTMQRIEAVAPRWCRRDGSEPSPLPCGRPTKADNRSSSRS